VIRTEADSNNITEQSRHDNPMPHLCTMCVKRFRERSSLTDHRNAHAGIKCIYELSVKNVLHQRYLEAHVNVHSSRNLCSECGKCFR